MDSARFDFISAIIINLRNDHVCVSSNDQNSHFVRSKCDFVAFGNS